MARIFAEYRSLIFALINKNRANAKSVNLVSSANFVETSRYNDNFGEAFVRVEINRFGV